MYNTIVVPLDGNHFAEQALGAATRMAAVFGARLHLVHIVDYLAIPLYARKMDARDWWNGEAETFAANYLESIAASLRATGVEVTAAIRVGGVPPSLAAEVAHVHADLVVMNTHGRGPVGRFWLGSVADRLVREALCPVLLIRTMDTGDAAANGATAFKKVLVTLDGSILAESALPYAQAIAHSHGAELIMLRVVPSTPVVAMAYPFDVDSWTQTDVLQPEEWEAAAQHYLKRAPEGEYLNDRPFRDVLVRDGGPADAILEYVRQHAVDLIVMTTHGRGGIKRFLLGSTTDQIVRAANVPVLVVPPLEEKTLEPEEER